MERDDGRGDALADPRALPTGCGLQLLPLEMLSKILSFLDAESICACAMVNSTWRELCFLSSVWKMAYAYRWFTSDRIQLTVGAPNWRELYIERHRLEISLQHTTEEKSNAFSAAEAQLLDAQNALEAALQALTAAAASMETAEATRASALQCTEVTRVLHRRYAYRFEQLVEWADGLAKRAADMLASAGSSDPAQVERLQQAALDMYQSAVAGAAQTRLAADSFSLCDAHYKLATLLAHVARGRELPEAQRLLDRACDAFASAAQPSFILYENALRHWADALVELGRKKDTRGADRDVSAACTLYARALEANPRYALAYYYNGRALRMLARGRRQLSPVLYSDRRSPEALFRSACEQFASALQLRPDDPYVMYECASTLHDLGLLRDSLADHAEAEQLLARASDHYESAHMLLPVDAWVLRNHADTLYDSAKAHIALLRAPLGLSAVSDRYFFFDDTETADAEPVRALLLQACAKYQHAVQLNPSYANALNSWGLALSTFAKLCTSDTEAEQHFAQAYEKFARAVSLRSDHQTEICNWAMTLVSHAMKRQRQRNPGAEWPSERQLLREAKDKLAPLLNSDPWTHFCMARRAAVRGREAKCRMWLERCVDKGYLRRATRWQLSYFHNMAHAPWFQLLLSAARAPPAPTQPQPRPQPGASN